MSTYLLALGVVFLCNVVPAFAPPTWIVLVFFSLRYDMDPIALIMLGLLGATSGRLILASLFRRYRSLLPKRYLANMQNASTHLTRSSFHLSAVIALFFISPLSSAQLFEAAGIMTRIPLRPLLLGFAAGRVVTYTTYVYGAHAMQATSFGEMVTRNMATPRGIAAQVAMVLGLVALGNVPWKPHIPEARPAATGT